MFRDIAYSAVFALALCTAGVAHAGSDGICQCRANGTNYDLDTVVCIRSGSLAFLARCEMVLNNTAWKKITDGCPTTANETPAGPVQLASAADAGGLCEPARWLGKVRAGSTLPLTKASASLRQ